ncbi:unnamed protein product [Effrenium voratum]|nr:unnamed protein product [Effrenium voratum]
MARRVAASVAAAVPEPTAFPCSLVSGAHLRANGKPLEAQEIFLDLAWGAWTQLARHEQRRRGLPKAQQMYEKVLSDAHRASGVSGLVSGDWVPQHFTDESLQILLRRAVPAVRPEDWELLIAKLPKEDGQVSFSGLMSWIFPQPAVRVAEWEARHTLWRQRAARRRGLLALSLISEPFEHCWREVFMDLAWSAWADVAAENRRRRSLPEPCRCSSRVRQMVLQPLAAIRCHHKMWPAWH